MKDYIVTQHQTKLALGSDTTLVLVGDERHGNFADVFGDLWRTIFQFERQFSRFIPMSELSAFNRSAGLKVPVSVEFRKLLLAVRRLGDLTDGLFNPFVLPALQRAGYVQSAVSAYATDPQEDYANRRVVAVDSLEIGDAWASIPYGTAIDIGGCGKGYLADLLADTVAPAWLQGFWFSLGGDIAGRGYDAQGRPWTVEIQNGSDESLDSVWSMRTDGGRFAVATSGTTVRKGVHEGREWHHIIDPKTGEPAISDTCMATVYGESTTDCDVLASCAVILGSSRAKPFLHGKPAMAVCQQTHNGQVVTYEQRPGILVEAAPAGSAGSKPAAKEVGHV